MDSFDVLVDQFAELVLLKAASLRRPDSDKANRCTRKYIAIFKELASYGDSGRDALARLLSHPSNTVRSTAAAWLLRHKHEEAMRVLHEVAKGNDMDAFCAGQCIKRWEEGEWQLDPAPVGSSCKLHDTLAEPPRTI